MFQIKNILAANACFSFSSAILMLIMNNYLQSIFGFSLWYVFPLVSANLLIFVIMIIYVIKKQLHNKIWIKLITGLDIAWVLGSIVLIAFNPFGLLVMGNILIAIVALIVGILAALQILALKK